MKELNFFSNVNLKYEKGSESNFETKIKEHASNMHVLVIIDVDNVESNTEKYKLIKRLHETKKYKGQIFFNNYSFELWLLNHINYFSKPVIKKIAYDGSMKDTFNVLTWSKYKNQRNRDKVMSHINYDSINHAMKNIKQLDKKTPFENPSSNMDEWVEKINKIK